MALEVFEKQNENEKIDLIFMDIGLPDMCGLDVIDQIRKYSKVPIIALTAHSDKEYIAELIKKNQKLTK